jgi:phosphate uptake regulator
MKRKVIKQANQAFTITLPIDWVRKNKIDEKSELNVIEDNKSLIVESFGQLEIKKIKIDVSGFEKRNLFRHINSLYAAGYDEVTLISDCDISSKITLILNSLIGYALVSQTKNTFVIKDIGGGGLGDLDEIFKRVFQAIILFYESAIRDIFGLEEETSEGLKSRDLEVNKLCFYLQRCINKMAYGDSVKGRAIFTYSFELERIGDAILHIWRENIENGAKKSKELKEVAILSKRCLEEAFDTYYMFNSKNLERYYDTRQLVRKKVENIKGNDVILRNIVGVAESSLDLTHLAMVMKLE